MKKRADDLVLARKLVESKSKAQALIMAGEILFRKLNEEKDWQKISKAGSFFKEDEVEFKLLNPKDKDVGRGAKKLRHALEHWKLSPNGIAIDIGSSTGGFTQVLLEKGASRVLALDVGYHQLHEKLRSDKRVLSVEKQHVLKVDEEFWQKSELKAPFDVLVADLSFISLTKVLAHVSSWLKKDKSFAILLLKPQFELSAAEVPKGIVRSQEARDLALAKLKSCVESETTWTWCDVIESPIKGTKGNVEYLVYLKN